jgi:hypothetical protein
MYLSKHQQDINMKTTLFLLASTIALLFFTVLPGYAEGEDPLTGEGSIDDHTGDVIVKPPVKK